MNRRLIAAVALAVTVPLAAAGCGGSDGDTSGPASTSARSRGSAPDIALPPTGGLLVEDLSNHDGTGRRLALVDVQTGKLTRIDALFRPKDPEVKLVTTPAGAGFSYASDAFNDQWRRNSISADWTKAVAVRDQDGVSHAGWVDRDGEFTDVTAKLSGPTSDFGRAPVSQQAVTFDRDGNFYFSETTSMARKVMRVDIGLTKPPTVFSTKSISEFSWDSAGNPVDFDSESCPGHVAAWIDADTSVYGDWAYIPHQIYTTRTPLRGLGCGKDGRPLLPADNETKIGSFVVSPDRTQILFYADVSDFKGMFVIPATGGAPKRTAVSWEGLGDYTTIVGWV
ncbi:MAG: hypothetical protein HOQ24_09405 [Mycobacteriaceae bacterium]|nr:hypothetical protein [Mycobacteriaceae bacterium]